MPRLRDGPHTPFMLIDLPLALRRHRDFRLLFIGQLISFLGSMVSYMAVPYQRYV